jgi:hypothetical protein
MARRSGYKASIRPTIKTVTYTNDERSTQRFIHQNIPYSGLQSNRLSGRSERLDEQCILHWGHSFLRTRIYFSIHCRREQGRRCHNNDRFEMPRWSYLGTKTVHALHKCASVANYSKANGAFHLNQ